MRSKLLFIFTVLITAVFAAAAAAAVQPPAPIHEPFTPLPCTGTPATRTTVQLEGCAEQKILKTDKTIDTLDSEIFTQLKAVAGGQSHFIAAHKAWLQYRTAFCRASSDQFSGGTAAPVADANCTVELNNEHIHDLTILLDDLTNE